MKFLKWFLIFAVILIALVVIIFHFALGPLMRRAAIANITRITETETVIEGLKVNLWRGNLRLTGLQIGNPEGFESPFFFRLDELSVDLQPRSLNRELTTVDSLIIRGIELNFEYEKLLADGNLGALLEQVGSKLEPAEPTPPPPAAEEADKRLRIDYFALSDVRLRFHSPAFAGGSEEIIVPSVELRDLTLPGEAGQQAVLEAVFETIAGIAEQPSFGRIAAAVGGAEMEQITGTPVAIGEIQLDPRAGRLIVRNTTIGNPPGYRTAEAFLLAEFRLEIDPESIFDDPLVIRQIVIDKPLVSYEARTSNILQSNVMDILTRIREQVAKDEPEPEKEAIGPTVHVDRFAFQNARVNFSAGALIEQTLSLPMPDLELVDLGKEDGTSPAVQIIDGLIRAFVRLVTRSPGVLGSQTSVSTSAREKNESTVVRTTTSPANCSSAPSCWAMT